MLPLQTPRTQWTKEKIDEVSRTLIAEHGCIPCTPWLQQNHLSNFCKAIVREYGGIATHRDRFYQHELTRSVSRDGQRWDSFAEACLANFLWSRGLECFRGPRYPPEYAAQSGQKWGQYDLVFKGTNGQYSGKDILIEVWGDKPMGHYEENYARKRQLKEEFNKGNQLFLGIGYKDCYNEAALTTVMQPYIGDVPPNRFGSEQDTCFLPTQWTLADEVLQMCRKVTESTLDNVLPPLHWFTRTHAYKNRQPFAWEPDSWGGFMNKIWKIGGWPKVRTILGQPENNMTMWSHSSAVEAVAEAFADLGRWPGALIHEVRKRPDTPENVLLRKRLRNIIYAVSKHVEGGMRTAIQEAKLLLGDDEQPTL